MTGIQETQLHCVADPLYYETPDRMDDLADRYPLDRAAPPDGWRRDRQGLWTSLRPVDAQVAEQGWKIHLSTVPDGAEHTLAETLRICLAHRVPFKFLRGGRALRLANAKYASRGSAGKFVTVYPAGEEQFLALLDEFTEALDGRPGPYILSDLRIGRGPVHVRYGAFVERWCPGEDGRPVPALRAPSGELVPDRREPAFRLPPWVTVPDGLRPHLAARAAARDDDFPYVVREALQFSAAGGIYLADHRDTGERVVLREARPHSGLDPAGTDAVTRLHREYRMLRRVAGPDCVPRVHEVRTVWEHHFLVEEFIEGTPLFDAVVTRYPLVRPDGTRGQLRAYTDWVGGVVDGLAKAIGALHERGVRFGDLHPANVVLRPDGSPVLVDFEYAADLADEEVPRAGAPGMQAPPELDGADADRHMLWATWLMMLMPLMELVEREPAKADRIEAWARRRFGLGPDAGPPRPRPRAAAAPERGGERIIDELFEGDAPDWPAIRAGLLAGLHSAATPGRPDRLFPGDPAGAAAGGVDVAHGAAGVLYALHRTDAPIPEAWTDWLVAAARRARRAAGGGLYDGLPGVAVVLDRLGRREEARELLDRCLALPTPPAVPGLSGGRAGLALARLRLLAEGDPVPGELLDLARHLDALAGGDPVPGLCPPSGAGLVHGFAGAALLDLELYERTGETWLLAAAGRALAAEAGCCVTMPDGSVQLRDGQRHLLYLDGGSGGLALVARRHLAHLSHLAHASCEAGAELAALLPGVRSGCGMEFVREPGLFHGRAGLLAARHALGAPSDGESSTGLPGAGTVDPGTVDSGTVDPETVESVRRLAWYLVARDGRLLVPGARLRRFSADLATGTAGVLLALHSVLDAQPVGLLGALTLE
ncbi:class III lanthionine synthetase LanKC [Kitasatospora sp. NPDC004240]